MTAFRGGDDHLLSGIGRMFEQDGFRMVGIRDVAPDMLMPEGRIARATPDPAATADIARGREVLRALGPFDIGQAVVVIDGHVVAVEDIEGTDGLLARVARLRGEGRIRAKAGRGVLVKAPKSSQDLRFDLPTVGPKTIEGVAEAGLAGIAVIAGHTIAAESQAMIEAADKSRAFHSGSARVMPARATAERTVFLIATEESGDRLGANLMKVLRQRLGGAVRFEGVGGRAMAREGLDSLFPIEELSIIGLAAVVKQLPKILRLISQTADAVTEAAPDILVIIDSPDFTHRVAKRVRARDARIPIVDYVSPSVWAWRPGRARAMRTYVDHVLALLPFEPEAYRRLRGPPCSYVGHPLTEQLAALRPGAEEAGRRDAPPPVLLVLPGSRRSEIRHHMAVFGQALGRLAGQGVAFEPVLPTMPHLQEAVAEALKAWPVQPRVVIGEAGEAGGVPDRACGAGEVRHRDARTRAGRRADGDGLPDRRGGGLDPAAGDQGEFGDPRQSRDRRERRARIPAGGLHAGKTVRRRCAKCSAIPRCGGSRSRPSPRSTGSCRPATSRPARARPTSCWRRCANPARGLAG